MLLYYVCIYVYDLFMSCIYVLYLHHTILCIYLGVCSNLCVYIYLKINQRFTVVNVGGCLISSMFTPTKQIQAVNIRLES